MEDDDDIPRLSSHTLAALQEFYEETMREGKVNASKTDNHLHEVKEDWQLSQFWYDNETADILATEAMKAAKPSGRIACISCPTVFQRLLEMKPTDVEIKLFEYDKRFEVYGDDYIFYDYNKPCDIDHQYIKSFDVVIADPPYLSEECLQKTAATIKLLAKDKIILCTGSVMEENVRKYLNLVPSNFQPKHVRKLGNDFSCYTNFDLCT